MKSELFRASTRGHVNHGWLDTFHTFSFAAYHHPERIHFGALRVVNDDTVIGGEGFDKHPHSNMEIISIPVYGSIEHKDSMGNTSIIRAGDIQVMSAGSGLYHSEYNADKFKPLNFLQIWIFSKEKDIEPRYEQKSFDFIDTKNELVQIVSPDGDQDSLRIHQDAWLHIGTFDKDRETTYTMKKAENGLFAMTLQGEFSTGEHGEMKLHHRDAAGFQDTDRITFRSNLEDSRLLLIEVPMQVDLVL